MSGKWEVTVANEDEPATCPECDGSGVSDRERFNFSETVNHDGDQQFMDCPVCCGFGRLDW